MLATIKEYFLNSSIHGFHFIVDKRFHLLERLFWTICVIITWFFSVVMILQVLHQYKENSISFQVDTSYLEWKIPYPSLVFCEQHNNVDLKLVKKWFPNEDTTLFRIVKKLIHFKIDDIPPTCDNVQNPETKRKCLSLGNFSTYMNDALSACTDLFTYCSFQGKSFVCCDFLTKIRGFFGPCYALNRVSVEKDSKKWFPFYIRREIGNLTIEIARNDLFITALGPNAIPSKQNLNSQILQTETRFLKANSTYNIFLSILSADASLALLDVDQNIRNCKFLRENGLKSSKIYELSVCQNECSIMKQLQYCNCVLHNYPTIKLQNRLVEECNITGIQCLSENAFEIISLVGCSCPTACRALKVSTIGTTEIRDSYIAHPRSLIRLNFIVNPPTVKYTRTLIRTPLDLIVSVGGILGLFMGASILTIVEIIFYFVVKPIGDTFQKLQEKRTQDKLLHPTTRISVLTIPYRN